MKNITITVLVSFLVIAGLVAPLCAQMATMEEARTVAGNWITLIIHLKGDWGGFETAEVAGIQEFKRGDHVLGYFCSVRPIGFMVISLRKELAPVKAYSSTCNLNPESDRGMSDLIKGRMERILTAIGRQRDPVESVNTGDILSLLEINYVRSWERLLGDPIIMKQELNSGATKVDYQEGEVLLSSSWHQRAPFNELCPEGNTACVDCDLGTPDIQPPGFPSLLGCNATAGSQVLNYWSWPPYGIGSESYDWDGDASCGENVGGGGLTATFDDSYYDYPNIANWYYWYDEEGQWVDENGNPLSQINLDAVEELCREIAIALHTDFGVCESGAYFQNALHKDLLDAFEDDFRYSTAADDKDRNDYTAEEWFSLIQAELNLNRPLPYAVTDHTIVCDGWQIVGDDRQYHMNYGWRDAGSNTWYTLDELPDGDIDEELLIKDLYPAPSLGSFLSGIYPMLSFPYRYFDQDAAGVSALFLAGQYLQFLPGVRVTSAGTVRFEGSSSDNTRLFSRGNTSRGIRIRDGAIELHTNGRIAVH